MYRFVVIGNGGREHAFCQKLATSKKTLRVDVLPGNPIFDDEKVRSHSELKNQQEWLSFIKDQKVDLVIVGPEAPICEGFCDLLRDHQFLVVGPSKKASRLESSKIFSKELMQRASIPTAKFIEALSLQDGVERINQWSDIEKNGIVIKADGLASGKGVYVADNRDQAEELFRHAWDKKERGDSGHDKIFLEERLYGQELSLFYLCRNTLGQKNISPSLFLGSAVDHKRLFERDKGPNTGGMGCVSVNHLITGELIEKVEQQILNPTLLALDEIGCPYEGFLFLGLMINDKNNPYVIEYNCRMGDPETQTILPLIESDLGEVLIDFYKGKEVDSLRSSDKVACHIVASSQGYAEGEMKLGMNILKDNEKITSFLQVEGVESHKENREFYLTFSGVKKSEDGLVNSSGRVLGVTALGRDLKEAREKSLIEIKRFNFEGMHYRADIGKKVLDIKRLGN